MSVPSLNSVIDDVLADSGYRDNPYFGTLTDGTFSREDFVETQIQFYWAVVFFSRPMAALAAKIPSPDLRLEIVRNVWEEHGEGQLGKVHGHTFIELLSRLDGLTPEGVLRRALWPEVRAFNTILTGVCVLDEYMTGVGVMGIIERMFSDISTWIGTGIVARGWLPFDRMVHYTIHQELDVKHSQDFFDIVAPAWDQSAENRYAIEQGLRLGAYAFNGLYEGLYRARARRAERVTRGMHSRAEG